MDSLATAKARARCLKLMAFDVDGVLSDGTLLYTDEGLEIKVFNCLDGVGLNMLQKSGITVAIITGRKTPCVEFRMQNLGIELLYQGITNKLEILHELLDKLGISADEAGFMGDDIIDLQSHGCLRLFGHTGGRPRSGETLCPVHFRQGRRQGRGA